jgi:gamma-glutamylcyclotransferase (GGCT)/AIG2-like uncharacterized protein YtfP
MKLFSYGTLRNPQIQRALFGVGINMIPATLHNHEIYADDDGYFHFDKKDGNDICGDILELNQKQIWIADQWEELTEYYRFKINVTTNTDITEEVYIYNKLAVKAYNTVEINQNSNNDIEDVIKEAGILNKKIELNKLPFSDVYIFFPCFIRNKGLLDLNCTTNYVNEMKHVPSERLFHQFAERFTRSFIDKCEMIINISGEEYLQTSDVYITLRNDTCLGVVTLAIPAISIPPLYLYHSISDGNFLVKSKNIQRALLLSEQLIEKGIEIQGVPRSVIFMSEKPAKDNLARLLAMENGNNLAQYESADIYASELSLVEVPKNFNENYLMRIRSQALTLFMIELILLQDASISGFSMVNKADVDLPRKDSLQVIEKLVSDYYAKR